MKQPSIGLLIQVPTAHLVSHLHMMVVPVLLPLLPGMMQVDFIEIGFALSVFNIVSALVQAPLGFLVDKVGAKRMLLAAITLGSFSFALVALFPTYAFLVVAMALAGLANGVYHPADYSLLSHGIEPSKMGRAFSIHGFAGQIGTAITPPLIIGVALVYDPRWAFAVATMAGLFAIVIVGLGETPDSQSQSAITKEKTEEAKTTSQQPLTTPLATLAILTLLYVMLSLSTGSISKFSVSALVEGFDVTLTMANFALTVFIFASAFGVLFGGVLADKTDKHGYVAAGAFTLAAVILAITISLPLVPFALIGAWGIVGFLTGMVAPSRDMLVRAASPAGMEGRTFGIVSTGFNVGGIIGPILFGLLLDHAMASNILWVTVCFMVITTVIVLLQEYYSHAKPITIP